MASPITFGGKNTGVNLPVPPPTLHTRTGSDLGHRPLTPTDGQSAWVSPVQTPQGSPSKNKLPPGAFDLPDVFSNAMKLLPTLGSSTNKTPKQQHSPTSPNRLNIQTNYDDPFALQQAKAGAPGSPTRKGNKENTPPTRIPQKENYISQAAASRQDPYRTRGDDHSPSRQKSIISGGLTPEDMEKLQKASVKRLANVTQLCMH